jgi:ATP-dependent DNA helicase PIF1
VLKNKFSLDRWQACECLVIDEVSMMDADLFEKLDAIAKTVRDSTVPFGGTFSFFLNNRSFSGIQLVLCGDFFQLPAVKAIGGLCFQSKVWTQCFRPENVFELTTIYRQQDPCFTDFLNHVRIATFSTISHSALNLLSALKRDLCIHTGILPTKLYCFNKDVDAENTNRLLQLKKPLMTFTAVDSGIPRLLER